MKTLYLLFFLVISIYVFCDSTPIANTIQLRIATYNVQNFIRPDSYADIATLIASKNIDILVLEETENRNLKPFREALEDVNTFFPYVYISISGEADKIGVFSKYEVTEISEEVNGTLKDPVSTCRYAFNNLRPLLRFKVLINESLPIWFYGGHLKAETDCYTGSGCKFDRCIKMRRAQAYGLFEYIRMNNFPEDHVIILGDMNTVRSVEKNDNSTLGFLSMKNDTDPDNDLLPANYTYKPELNTHEGRSRILDHILISPSLFPHYRDINVIQTHKKGNYHYSDHYPVILDLEF